MKRHVVFVLLLVGLAGVLYAADPPGMFNYQGVLRDASDHPLSGDYNMTFRLYDAETGGTLLLTDSHVGATTVTVSDGLFDVAIGSGIIIPGAYATLEQVFGGESAVHLEVLVGSDPPMTPRIRVLSTAYALNSQRLAGKTAGDFIDTSTSSQTKSGPLVVDVASVPGSVGVTGRGNLMGAYFQDLEGSGKASLAFNEGGIVARGNEFGGVFQDTDGSGFAWVGHGDDGIEAYGNRSGGYFWDKDNTGEAYVAFGNRGIEAKGSEMGAYFNDTEGTSWAALGWSGDGISAHGNLQGGFFEDTDGTSSAHVAYGNRGIEARGLGMGGYFEDTDGSGKAWLGYNEAGIEARGNWLGGLFSDADSSAIAWVAHLDDGIKAQGNRSGGYFQDKDNSGEAFVGYGNRGIEASGTEMGGYFSDADGSGIAIVGAGARGVVGLGQDAGGYFYDSNNSGRAWIGYGDNGIEAEGNTAGGHFKDLDNSGEAFVGYGDAGIEARGTEMGGYFEQFFPSGTWESSKAWLAWNWIGILAGGQVEGGQFHSWLDGSSATVATGTYKIRGNGSVNFVQNHPDDVSRVIVYAAPEGDEVATYTRGTARLVGGEARVPLGETFRWVTNPDIGLTAYVTPRGEEPIALTVRSLNTSELLVRGPNGSDALFDYVVYGLRIGFEETSVVQEKEREAYIPSMRDHRERYAGQPELRRYNALERFKSMRTSLGKTDPLDLSHALALREAIQEFDPAIHAIELPAAPKPGGGGRSAGMDSSARTGSRSVTSTSDVASSPAGRAFFPGASPPAAGRMDAEGNVYGRSFRPASAELAGDVPVGEPVEVGDVLVVDRDDPTRMRPSTSAADPAVAGIVAGEPGVLLGRSAARIEQADPELTERLARARASGDEESVAELSSQLEQTFRHKHAPVAQSGMVLCKVDAGFGAIAIGDLLTTSPVRGHAMLAADPQPGTIVAKALEPLESGTGLIRVLVMLR